MITECESCKFKIATTESLETERNNLREALKDISESDHGYDANGNKCESCTNLQLKAQEALTQPNQNRGEVVG